MNKAEKKRRYTELFNAVRGVIHKWDPYGLLALGCPNNEFDSEISSVVRQIERIASPQDAAHVLSRIFSSAFQTEGFQVADCVDVGRELYNVLQTRDLLTMR